MESNPSSSEAVRIGTVADEDMLTGPLARRRDLLARVHDAGLSHVFVADHISFYTGLGMDGLIQAATLAALNESLFVHVGVYLLALRHPLPVARQIAQISESAPGRLHLGVGVGGEDRHEIEVCGVDPTTRGKRTDESLIALRGLLTGEKTSHDCAFFQFEDALIRPAPNPAVPIVIGGRSNAAIRRAATLGDGWLGVWCSAKRYGAVVSEIQTLSDDDSALRAPDHGLQVWVGIDSDRARARERLAKRMEGMYHVPFERFEKYSPYGEPEAIADFLAPYISAGCRHLNIMPVAESSDAAVDGITRIHQRLDELR